MEAIWGANTINLNYVADGATFTPENNAANTCIYDDKVTIPTNVPTKPGYTFDHWAVVVPMFNLVTLSNQINVNGSAFYAHGYINNSDFCTVFSPQTGYTTNENICVTEPALNDVSVNEWKVKFNYGTVRRISYCSAKSGSNHNGEWDGNSLDWKTTESELISAGTGGFCWCQATGFAGPDNDTYRSVASSLWFFGIYIEGTCGYSCSRECADFTMGLSKFRSVLYGILN